MSNDIKFIHCPLCGSKNVFATDYQGEDGKEDTESRHCSICGWDGDVSELVAAE